MKIQRHYQDLDKYFTPGRVLLLFGPRRVGKTTLLRQYLKNFSGKSRLVNGDNLEVQEILGSQSFKRLTTFVESLDLLAIDEAQLIPNIGMGLKILVDNFPKLKIIATGSSSFELAGQVGEPLVGRKWDLKMYPVALLELKATYNAFELEQLLPDLLVYGSYPAVITEKKQNKKIELLNELRDSYLFKDILAFQEVKGSKVLLNILKLLAFQVGSEVSLNEIATQVGLDYKTVGRYLDLFEKSFIIFNLGGYSRNLRKEITTKSKYYFFDTGLRNAIISSYNSLENRNDLGQLWENFLVAERLKKMQYHKIYANTYFWRTWDQHEIDWIEEREGKLFGFEFKYNGKQAKHAQSFTTTYPEGAVEVVNKENYLQFLS